MDSALGWSAAHRWARGHGGVVDGCLALAMVAILAPVTVRTIWASSWSSTLEVLALLVVLLGHGAVALRRSSPRVALGIAGGLVLFLLLTPALDPGTASGPFSAVLVPSVLVFPVVLYSVAAWCSHQTSLLALTASVAGSLLVVVRLWGSDYLTVAQPGLASPQDPVASWPLFLVLGLVAMVVAPWCAGRYRRLGALYVAELADRAAEQERRRIAREMHDVVAHSLSVMVSQAEGGRLMAVKDPASAAPVLDNIARAGREAMQDMRGVLHVLHQDAGEQDQAQPTLADLPELVATVRRSGLPVRLEQRGAPQRMSRAAELAAYRITQEALTNVLKHAGSDATTRVLLSWRPESLELTVGNRVEGRRRATAGPGRGLSGMDDRLAALGGTVDVTSDEDCFTVAAHIPTAAGAASRPAMSIRVFLADDQDLVREGLAMIVASQDDLVVVGEAGDGAAAVAGVTRTAPDVVLMDVRMPVLDGVQAATRILRGPSPPRVLMLTTFDVDEHAFAALRAGASGFLLKSARGEDVVQAIRSVHRGDAVIAPEITRRLLDQVELPGPRRLPPEVRGLTPREREIMREVATGASNAEIAARLFVSEATVKTHVGRVLSKLGLRDRVQIVVLAYEAGLVRPHQ